MGELLEDGVLRVGVSGTLASMRIGARGCLEAWRFQGTRGGLEWLEGQSLSEHAAASASGFELRLVPDMMNSPAVHISTYMCAVKRWSLLPSMLTLCNVSECTVQYKATPLSPSLPLRQQAKATGVHAMFASKAALQIRSALQPSRHRMRLRVGRHLLASRLLPPKAD